MKPSETLIRLQAKIKSEKDSVAKMSLEDERAKFIETVSQEYRKTGSLILKEMSTLLLEGNLKSYDEAARYHTSVINELRSLLIAANDFTQQSFPPLSLETLGLVFALYGQENVSPKTKKELKKIIDNHVDNHVDATEIQASKSNTEKAYKEMGRGSAQRKNWKCCDEVRRHKTEAGEEIWATTCYYKDSKGSMRPFFRNLGSSRNPRPRRVTAGGKVMKRCTKESKKLSASFERLSSKLRGQKY